MDHQLFCNLEEFKIRTFLIEVWFQRTKPDNPSLYLFISVTESISQSIDNIEFSCGLFGAFDTINCAVLLKKFEAVCIIG